MTPTFFSVSNNFARFLITLAVVIASVVGAAENEIAVAVIASTALSSTTPATPVGISKISPIITSAVE